MANYTSEVLPEIDYGDAPPVQVGIGQDPVAPPQVSIDNTTGPMVPSVPTAAQRAQRASFGMLGLSNKTYDDYLSQFANGQEPWERRDAASTVDLFKANKLQERIPSLLNAAPGSNAPNWLLQQAINEASKNTDPNSVFEDQYARQYIDTLNWAKPTPELNFWSDAVKKIPLELDEDMGQGREALQYRAYILKKLEDQYEVLKNQGYPGYIWDQITNSLQLYKEVRERYAAGSGALLQGGSHEELRKELLSQDYPNFKVNLDKIVDSLSGNPSLAAEFLSDMASMSTQEIALKNLFSITAIPDMLALSKVGANLARGTTQNLVLRNQIRRALTTSIQSETTSRPAAVVAPAAAGDLAEASATTVAGQITDTLKGVKSDPIKQSAEKLVSALRLDLAESIKDPGNLGQEGVNRMVEDTTTLMRKVQNALTNVLKVERIPGFLAIKEAVKAYKEGLKDLYPGFRNSILDIKDPEWDSLTNTYRFPIHFGDGDKYFETPAQAYHAATLNGLIPAEETLLRKVNDHFGVESSKLVQQIKDIRDEIKRGPAMDADVHELNRHAALPGKADELTAKLEDLQAWHGEKLTEPGIDKILLKKGPGFTVEQSLKDVPPVPAGHVRFYHGGENPTSGGSRWVTPDLNYAAPRGQVHYVDIPENSPHLKKSFDDTGTSTKAPYVHFDAPGNIAKNLKPLNVVRSEAGFTVQPQGNGYYIRITKTLNETDSIVRNALLKTKESWTPRGFFKDMLGWVRTPEETMSDIQKANRKIASYAPSVFLKLLKEDHDFIEAVYKGVIKKDPITGEKINFVTSRARAIFEKNFSSIHGDRLDRFVKMLDGGRYLIDPDSGKNGYFFKTPGEFTRTYVKTFNVSPDPVETAAYFSFKRHYEADHAFREVILHKNASRLGAEEHQVVMYSHDGTKQESSFFHGIKQMVLPGGDDLIGIVERRGDAMQVLPTTKFSPKQAEKWRKMVAEGKLTVIKLFNSANRPLAGYAGIEDNQVIRYVIAPNVNTRPLEFGNMLPRRGGGHIVYDYPKYLKQAKISPVELSKERVQHWYEGDTTIMPISNGAMGAKIAEHLNQVRIFLLEDKQAEAKAYAQSNLPMSWEDIHGWFLPKRDPKGILREPRLSKTEPIHVVDRNRTIGQMSNDLANRYIKEGKSTFHDATLDGSPGEKFRVQFTGERDADLVYTINDYGTRNNPLYKYEPAQMVDPMTTLNRSLKEIANSYFMDDYKIFSIEHWIQRAEKYLDTGKDKPQTSIMSQPFYYFYNGKLKPGTPWSIASSIKQERFKINSFIGTPGIVQTTLHDMSQSLADAIYEKAGPGPTIMGHRPYLAPSILLENITKPADMLLRATYHATIGMWSIAQLFAQSMTYVTIHGIAGPTKAGPGTFGALLHQYYRFNNAFIGSEAADALDNLAVKMKLFRPGEWKEAVELLERTGFDHVGPEHQILEKIYTPRVVSNGIASFLNAGDIIFKGTERNARYGAWFTAYKEFRSANPTGRVTNKNLAYILDRADLLSGNMSKASKSALQMGIGAFPTQFLGYNMRLTELATGSRMTKAQVARLVTTWSLAFGLPNALSLGAFPAGDFLRQYALENGYVVGDGFWKDMGGLGIGLSSVMMEGLPAAAINYATGSSNTSFVSSPSKNIQENMQSGEQINFGQRYGSPGIDLVRQAFLADKPMATVLAGAPGTFVAGILQHTNKYVHNAIALMSGDPAPFKMKVEDLVEPLRIVNSINSAYRGFVAANTGMWMSKNENILEGGPTSPEQVSAKQAILMTLTGTQPTQVADLNNWSATNKLALQFQKDIRTLFIKEYHRYMLAVRNNDPSGAEDYLKNAYTYVEAIGHYPIEKRDRLIADAEASFEDMVGRLESGILTHNVPTDTSVIHKITGGKDRPDTYQDIAERMKMLQEKRGQR